MSRKEKKYTIYLQLMDYFNDAVDDIFDEVEIDVMESMVLEYKSHISSPLDQKIYEYLNATYNVIKLRRELSQVGERQSDY